MAKAMAPYLFAVKEARVFQKIVDTNIEICYLFIHAHLELNNERTNLKARKKRSDRHHLLPWVILAVILAIVCSVAPLIKSGGEKIAETRHPDSSPYSDEELKQFWENHAYPIMSSLINHTYHIPEINDRYLKENILINKRYGTLKVHMSQTYITNSHEIMAASQIKSNTAIMILVIPKMLIVYRGLESSRDPVWRERFENVFVISVMHELDHLTYEKIPAKNEKIPLDKLVELEKQAWALTCEYTLAPLVEKYNSPLESSDQIYYTNWIYTGRSVDSPAWEKFIRDAYKVTRHQ